MAEVHIVDIDGEQWDIKDLPLTTRVATLEEKISGLKAMRHDLSKQLPETPSCLWDCILKVIPNTDWSFIPKDVWSYGSFEVKNVCWGTYEALRHSDNTIEVKGTLTYNADPHVFSAYYDVNQAVWHYQVDSEMFGYLQNGILITQTADRQYNGFAVPSTLFVRNIAQTTVGNLYAALETSGLLNRPSTGILVWDLQRQHNGVDLPKATQGQPIFATSSQIDLFGRVYLQNIKMEPINQSAGYWWVTWSDGNIIGGVDMWGEPLEGIIPAVSLVYTV